MKRKTEAWLVDTIDDRSLHYTRADAEHEQSLYGGTITPLVRRDPKEEAVVRSALKLEKYVHYFLEFPEGFHSDALDVAKAAAEYRASRKKAKGDYLDEVVAERTKRNRKFPAMVATRRKGK
jgi:hypothetical protein